MAYSAIAQTVPQYYYSGVAASGFYLKFYKTGTTTAINMATDNTGGTLLAKCQINAQGFPINGSSAVFIPHIDQAYKIVLYQNAADADANTTGNAAWVIDNILVGSGRIITDTTATLKSDDFSSTDYVSTQGLATKGDGLHDSYYKTGNTGTASSGTWPTYYDSAGNEFSSLGGKTPYGQAILDAAAADNGAALTTALAAYSTVSLPPGTFNFTTEVTIPSNCTIIGAGKGVTILNYNLAANPGSDSFLMKAQAKSNIYIGKLTLTTACDTNSIYDTGTYSAGDNTYTGALNGMINCLLISSCTDVMVDDVEVSWGNYHGIRVGVEGSTASDYNERLFFHRIYGHHCRITPLSIMGVKVFRVWNCDFTDNGLIDTDTGFIDGSTGYGVVCGRLSNELRGQHGWVHNNYCRRNTKHGIDVHAGADIKIYDNIIEDALLIGIAYQDIGTPTVTPADIATVLGDAIIDNNIIKHTSWVETQYSVLCNKSAGVEETDSCGILVSRVGQAHLQNVFIRNNRITTWRYRQLTTNTAADQVLPIIASANGTLHVTGNESISVDADYSPSGIFNLAAPRLEIKGNTFRARIRSTVNKATCMFAGETSYHTVISDNVIQRTNVYSDTAGTVQAAYPFFQVVDATDLPVFTNNVIDETTQGTRGSLIKTAQTNHLWGYNNVFSRNEGNMLNELPYSSHIIGDYDIYISAAGGGNYSGSTSSDPFECNAASDLDWILSNNAPRCNGTLTIHLVDLVDLGSTTPTDFASHPCIYSDKVVWTGDATDNTLALTKTGGLITTGSNALVFPLHTNNWLEYIQVKSGGVAVVRRPTDVNACSIIRTSASAGTYCILCEYQNSRVYKTYVANSAFAIAAESGATISSIGNDDDPSNIPLYGLHTNGGIIMKNSTQPAGSTANELSQNGGVIR